MVAMKHVFAPSSAENLNIKPEFIMADWHSKCTGVLCGHFFLGGHKLRQFKTVGSGIAFFVVSYCCLPIWSLCLFGGEPIWAILAAYKQRDVAPVFLLTSPWEMIENPFCLATLSRSWVNRLRASGVFSLNRLLLK